MVRRIVVSLGLQTSAMDISVINGVAYLKGRVERTDVKIMKIKRDFYYSEELVSQKLSHEYRSTLEALDKQIRVLPGIKGAVYKFRGWQKKIGHGWIQVIDGG